MAKAKAKKAAKTTAKQEPTGFYRVEHNIVGQWTQGTVITEEQLRAVPGFSDGVDDEAKNRTYNQHLNRLMEAGALKIVTEDEASKAGSEGAPEDEGGGSPPADEDDGLDSMSKAELLRAAEEDGVEDVDRSTNNADIIAAIRAKRAEGGGEGGEAAGGGEDEE